MLGAIIIIVLNYLEKNKKNKKLKNKKIEIIYSNVKKSIL